MRISAILPLLSTLSLLATAEPIPGDVKSAMRAVKGVPEDVGGVVQHLAKRVGGLENKVFGDDENGPRYWAWSKLAYDDDWNAEEQPRTLVGGEGTKWALLTRGNKDIQVRGRAARSIDSPWGGGWTTYTGMKVVVGLDKLFKTVVMAFIGSNDLPTAETDLKFFQTRDMDGKIPGQLETGFYEAYRSVQIQAFMWAKAWAEENPDYDIVITGHSLGGATAHIAAVGWVKENPQFKDRTTVFTYGAPRAGDQEFQEELARNQGSRMMNFRHRYDLVTNVPAINLGIRTPFANPGGRAEFDGKGKWSDISSWTFDDMPDTETHRYQSIRSVVKDMIHKFDEHTGYFPSVNPAKRAVETFVNWWTAPSDDNPDSSDLQKRAALGEKDFRAAHDSLLTIRQSRQLRSSPIQWTREMQQYADALDILSDQAGVLGDLNVEGTENDRLTYLTTLMFVAMEAA